eukprot:CAMPEP_0114651758 /NCGR_PEP_ID=MMETSP0191-20121206/8552_1 /TAXON_ID=126664 /ORGANISM="Sorites sp." /LENGTH=212 /DNA_ID=CAMNT_0001866069 /DNA_START=279 /DNA_END=919 /DNA_ORIENTATION=+
MAIIVSGDIDRRDALVAGIPFLNDGTDIAGDMPRTMDGDIERMPAPWDGPVAPAPATPATVRWTPGAPLDRRGRAQAEEGHVSESEPFPPETGCFVVLRRNLQGCVLQAVLHLFGQVLQGAFGVLGLLFARLLQAGQMLLQLLHYRPRTLLKLRSQHLQALVIGAALKVHGFFQALQTFLDIWRLQGFLTGYRIQTPLKISDLRLQDLQSVH